LLGLLLGLQVAAQDSTAAAKPFILSGFCQPADLEQKACTVALERNGVLIARLPGVRSFEFPLEHSVVYTLVFSAPGHQTFLVEVNTTGIAWDRWQQGFEAFDLKVTVPVLPKRDRAQTQPTQAYIAYNETQNDFVYTSGPQGLTERTLATTRFMGTFKVYGSGTRDLSITLHEGKQQVLNVLRKKRVPLQLAGNRRYMLEVKRPGYVTQQVEIDLTKVPIWWLPKASEPFSINILMRKMEVDENGAWLQPSTRMFWDATQRGFKVLHNLELMRPSPPGQ